MMAYELDPTSHEYEPREALLDMTDYDFSDAPLYRTKDSGSFRAVQLTEDRTIIRSWGRQDMVVGDWVVYKPGSDGELKESGVRRAAFDLTYVDQGDGTYRKEAYIRAIRIDQPYQFIGVDSEEPERPPAGSYYVLNMDKHQQPIIIDGRPDVFFYKEDDLTKGYDLVAEEDGVVS